MQQWLLAIACCHLKLVLALKPLVVSKIPYMTYQYNFMTYETRFEAATNAETRKNII